MIQLFIMIFHILCITYICVTDNILIGWFKWRPAYGLPTHAYHCCCKIINMHYCFVTNYRVINTCHSNIWPTLTTIFSVIFAADFWNYKLPSNTSYSRCNRSLKQNGRHQFACLALGQWLTMMPQPFFVCLTSTITKTTTQDLYLIQRNSKPINRLV